MRGGFSQRKTHWRIKRGEPDAAMRKAGWSGKPCFARPRRDDQQGGRDAGVVRELGCHDAQVMGGCECKELAGKTRRPKRGVTISHRLRSGVVTALWSEAHRKTFVDEVAPGNSYDQWRGGEIFITQGQVSSASRLQTLEKECDY